MTSVRWPDDARPEGAAIHAVNVLESEVSPEAVWPWLLRAARWGEWYANCHDLRFVGAPGPDLRLGDHLTWRTFSVPVATVVTELVPFERLAWRGSGLGATGYHAWLLQRVGTGVRLVTEETQRGVIPWLGRPLLRPGLHRWHQRWLEGLVRVARLGPPDTVAISTTIPRGDRS
jgi:hypothetical protein